MRGNPSQAWTQELAMPNGGRYEVLCSSAIAQLAGAVLTSPFEMLAGHPWRSLARVWQPEMKAYGCKAAYSHTYRSSYSISFCRTPSLQRAIYRWVAFSTQGGARSASWPWAALPRHLRCEIPPHAGIPLCTEVHRPHLRYEIPPRASTPLHCALKVHRQVSPGPASAARAALGCAAQRRAAR